MSTTRTSEVINSFSGKYQYLSNFYPAEVELGDDIYNTVEHAYQAAKTLDSGIRETIRRAGTPAAAKKIGNKVLLRPDWDDVKQQVMYDLLLQKFAPGTPLFRLLSLTRGSVLQEGNWWNDQYWGVCNGYGQNILGKLLMTIRDGPKYVKVYGLKVK